MEKHILISISLDELEAVIKKCIKEISTPIKQESFLDHSICWNDNDESGIYLSVGCLNVLRGKSLDTYNDIVNFCKTRKTNKGLRELLSLRGFGKRYLYEVIEMFKKHNIEV